MTNSNYSPVSRAAQSFRKGLPTQLLNSLEANLSSISQIPMTKSRAVNYKNVCANIEKIYHGMILSKVSRKTGSRKSQGTAYIVLHPEDGIVTVKGLDVPFRDPQKARWGSLSIHLTQHVLERIYQRGKNLGDLNMLMYLLPHKNEDGRYELYTEHGMLVASIEKGIITVITFVDSIKLKGRQIGNKPGTWRKTAEVSN